MINQAGLLDVFKQEQVAVVRLDAGQALGSRPAKRIGRSSDETSLILTAR
jgi:hypothetical protein